MGEFPDEYDTALDDGGVKAGVPPCVDWEDVETMANAADPRSIACDGGNWTLGGEWLCLKFMPP